MASSAARVLFLPSSSPLEVADAAERIAGASVRAIDESLPGALTGERTLLRNYVGACRTLTTHVLDAVDAAGLDVVLLDEAHRGANVAELQESAHAHRAEAGWPAATLAQEAMSAPFSEWVGALGAGRGTAVALVAHLRRLLAGIEPLAPPYERRLLDWGLDERGVVSFYRAVLDELSRVDTPLDQITSALGLTQTELARLFGVRRQAVEQWARRGVPAERQEKLATVGEIADLLAAKLKRERIPGVVRRTAPAYGERSILQAIADDDENLVLAELRDTFDWAVAA